jgi:hypothetical protein
MYNEDEFSKMYNLYFSSIGSINPSLEPNPQNLEEYTYNKLVTKDSIETTYDVPEMSTLRLLADGNIDSIEQVGEVIKKMLNAAWGIGWGDFTPEFAYGEDPDNVVFPQITFDINNRDITDNKSKKPTLTDTVKEVVNGVYTGDSFNIYRQWFDNIVEFNFYAKTNLEARRIMSRFETLMTAYCGFLKRQGISEILFLREVPPKMSMNYIEGIPMRSIMYYVKLERIQVVRNSTIKRIDVELNVKN